ncbi:bifunctional peptidase and (3S)-lysyl hydroxylase Jmjd7 [Lutzomyia longipalpis]|uniref:bifunctional peptidase and (3S)-lysyl hydroxylase Jmjd7 n=1 Tax=Lutzomyia longipalpis TaxID=7200 RepID=UPI0024841E55|nr:bifunctional peptidase and (3S)-lysyl hydroxylase Jmjd7 [Lutzomyia longipalpis]
MQSSKIIQDALDFLSQEAQELYLGPRIPELFDIPTSLQFTRDYVAKNMPVILRGCLHWPAITKWSSKYFRNTIGGKDVTVAVTPNGYADGIAVHEKKDYFVMPEEQEMKMGDFLDKLDNKSDLIYYIQKQNSNLSTDFHELLNDIDMESLNFSKESFNKDPDAINFWMGDERAVTSMHKDPYENMYCVISGYKDFVLIPPVCYHNVPRKVYPSAVYKTDQRGKMTIEPLLDEETKKPVTIEWVSVDPLDPDLKTFPQYSKAIQYEVRVNAGDILYLPSFWYHHVRQSHKCIAVNFWYDMDYDARYCYYRMIEKLCANKDVL